jgi:biopolymer transport protein ExbD
MSMSTGGGKTGAKPDINITPLIDVLLVMIIIFMVIKHKDPHRFENKVPEKPKEQQQNVDVSLSLVITIDRTGLIKLNSQEMTDENLRNTLKKTIEGRPSDLRTVFIKGPREIPYEKVVKLIDIAKGAGAAPIGLQIDNID